MRAWRRSGGGRWRPATNVGHPLTVPFIVSIGALTVAVAAQSPVVGRAASDRSLPGGYSRPMTPQRGPGDVLVAAGVAAIVSGAPSTLDTLRRGDDLLASSRAAGAMVVGVRRSGAVQLAAAVPVHLALSLGWTAVLARVLPQRYEPAWGAVGGIAIAATDLGLIGRRIAPIAALPQRAQWADHVAFGFAVGVVLRARRLRARGSPW